jgi:hypothetical protein
MPVRIRTTRFLARIEAAFLSGIEAAGDLIGLLGAPSR